MNAAQSFCAHQLLVRDCRELDSVLVHGFGCKRSIPDSGEGVVETRHVHTAVELSRHLRGGIIQLDDAPLHRGALQKLHVDPLSVLIHRHVVQAGGGSRVERFPTELLTAAHKALA